MESEMTTQPSPSDIAWQKRADSLIDQALVHYEALREQLEASEPTGRFIMIDARTGNCVLADAEHDLAPRFLAKHGDPANAIILQIGYI